MAAREAAAAHKRRGKAQYVPAAKRARADAGRQLEVGMCGILITCNMNQRKCVAEAYSLLGEYGEQLYGPEQFTDRNDSSVSGSEEEAKEEDDAEAAMRKEVDLIRASTTQRLRRFQSVESGANNVVFIRTLGVEPEKLVHHILKDMHTTKKKKTRVILRMLPVSGTCKAFLEDMKRYAETFFEPWFKAPQKGTFQIAYKARNNSHLSREEVIKELAGVVSDLNPENKVDLGNPKFTIVVEIIKNICCLSVAKDYVLFRKYNLQEVVKDGQEDRQPGAPKAPREGSLEGAEKTTEDKDPHGESAEEKASDNHKDSDP
ncbi:THUMP domain-containing protein 1 [Sphaerodactylus townsendi]|uniref:THUMP domain-containing protein 1 n=1 Tax=Sphaerodactylus townsendi TaxID=933632 RepID=A0ACB8FKY3_9SAUR|nr:THUMP domain-containing protein 1 [Sphaerodactylus townsendi]